MRTFDLSYKWNNIFEELWDERIESWEEQLADGNVWKLRSIVVHEAFDLGVCGAVVLHYGGHCGADGADYLSCEFELAPHIVRKSAGGGPSWLSQRVQA